MKSLVGALVSLVAMFFVFAIPLLAQSPTPTSSAIPTPQPGFEQSDYANDAEEGMKSIQNDKNAKEDQKEIDENEIDEAQEEEKNVDVDEEIDQDEAQEDINDNAQEDQNEDLQGEDVNGNQEGESVGVKEEERGQKLASPTPEAHGTKTED